MLVKLFQSRFAEAVRSGAKRQTIRPLRKDGKWPEVGEAISCREWSGKPYRSKQRLLRESTVTEVSGVVLTNSGIWLDRHMWGLDRHMWEIFPQPVFKISNADAFAKDDGFTSWQEMLEWFTTTHGEDVFYGMLIKWK